MDARPLGLLSFAVDEWLAGRPSAASVIFGTQLTEAYHSGESRGLGLFATRTVPAFAPLLAETPLILLNPNDDLPELYTQFATLSDRQRKHFLSLSHQENPDRDVELTEKLRARALNAGVEDGMIPSMVKVANVMQTNAFNVDLQDGQGARHRAVFARIARINHSCAPNAHVCFYPSQHPDSQGRMVVRALKPLSAGEEVLISYFNILLPRAERQAKTQKWGFCCKCAVCERQASDKMNAEGARTTIRDFMSAQAQEIRRTRSSVAGMNRMIKAGKSIALDAEDAFPLLPLLPDLYDALGLLQAKELLLRQRETERDAIVAFLELATIWESRITGPESPATARRLVKLRQFASKKGLDLEPRIRIDDSDRFSIEWFDKSGSPAATNK